MSALVYPSNLPGLTFDSIRSYEWDTSRQKALSGKESALSRRAYPLVHFELLYEFLRDTVAPSDLKALVGLHNAMLGQFDTFLYTDPVFNTVAAQQFGTSTGSTATLYQLIATYQNTGGPGASEIVQNLNGTPTLFDNGTPIAGGNYTISATGVVQFSVSPTSGHTLTWSGSFYYRCRFDEDALQWKQFLAPFWTVPKVAFTSILL